MSEVKKEDKAQIMIPGLNWTLIWSCTKLHTWKWLLLCLFWIK